MLSCAQINASVRKRRGGVAKFAEIVHCHGFKTLRRGAKYRGHSFVVRRVNVVGRQYERGTEAPHHALFPNGVARLRVETTEHAIVEDRVKMPGMINRRWNISHLLT